MILLYCVLPAPSRAKGWEKGENVQTSDGRRQNRGRNGLRGLGDRRRGGAERAAGKRVWDCLKDFSSGSFLAPRSNFLCTVGRMAAEYCRIPDIFDYHSALNDAMYTAVLGAWLTPGDLAWRPEPGRTPGPAGG